jgi:hypothetical protein
MLDDEESKVATFDARNLDSRLGNSSTAPFQRYTLASARYRVQGHIPINNTTTPRMTVKEILKMPKGT